MKTEQIERIWNDLQMSTGAFGDLNPESQFKVRSFVQAIELQLKDDFDKAALALRTSHEGASHALDIMMRTYGAAVAWRDKYKVAKGQEVFALMLVELCNNVMDAVGWHPTGEFDAPTGTVKLVMAPEAKKPDDLGGDPNAGHGGYNWGGIG